MNGETFVYDGRLGPWVCTIYLLTTSDSNFSAVSDIVFRGQHRCKLVLSRPGISTAAGIDMLKHRCITWIEHAELDSAKTALSP